MKGRAEVLLKSFGNGVAMLRFQAEQTPSTISAFVADLGVPTQEFVIGDPPMDVFLMFEEGLPVTEIEARNTDDEWESLVTAVEAGGSESFKERVSNLGLLRRSLADVAEVS